MLSLTLLDWIALAIFGAAYWFGLSFFQCTIILLAIGVCYKYIQQGTRMLDGRIAALFRRFRNRRSGAARQEA